MMFTPENADTQTEILDSFTSAIDIKNLNYAYSDTDFVLENISFSFEKGKKYIVVGRSGCGKSTLLNILTKDIEVCKGQIFFDQKDYVNISLNEVHKKISKMFIFSVRA